MEIRGTILLLIRLYTQDYRVALPVCFRSYTFSHFSIVVVSFWHISFRFSGFSDNSSYFFNSIRCVIVDGRTGG